mgnify:FL=1
MSLPLIQLIRVRNTGHATHDTQDVVRKGVNTDLGGFGTLDSSRRKNKLKNSVVNS